LNEFAALLFFQETDRFVVRAKCFSSIFVNGSGPFDHYYYTVGDTAKLGWWASHHFDDRKINPPTGMTYNHDGELTMITGVWVGR
jgi:hypothetical protein